MARFLDLPFSDVRDLLQALDNAGVSTNRVKELMRNPRKFKQIVEAFVKASSSDQLEQVSTEAEQPAPIDKPLVGLEAMPKQLSTSTIAWRQ